MRKAARKQLHACMEVPPGFDAEADGRGLCGASIARSGVGTVSSHSSFCAEAWWCPGSSPPLTAWSFERLPAASLLTPLNFAHAVLHQS